MGSLSQDGQFGKNSCKDDISIGTTFRQIHLDRESPFNNPFLLAENFKSLHIKITWQKRKLETM